MTLPKEAELLGANSDELKINSSGAQAVVKLNTDLHRNPLVGLVDPSGNPSRDRIYLVLENIKGTQDATVLNVYLNLPEGKNPGDYHHLLAGSVGLYGLRRASIQPGEDGGLGLTFVLDITQILIEQPAAMSPGADEIRISILPHPQLPDLTNVVVGRLSIFRQRHLA